MCSNTSSSSMIQSSIYLKLIGPHWSVTVAGQKRRLAQRYLAICYYLLIEVAQSRKRLKELFFPYSTNNNLKVQLYHLRRNNIIKIQEDPIQLEKATSDLAELDRYLKQEDDLSVRDICRLPHPSLQDTLEIHEKCNFSDEFYGWICQQQIQQERRCFYSRLQLAQDAFNDTQYSQSRKYAEEAYLFLKNLNFDLDCDHDLEIFQRYLASLVVLLDNKTAVKFKEELRDFGITIPSRLVFLEQSNSIKKDEYLCTQQPKLDFNLAALKYLRNGEVEDLAYQLVNEGFNKIRLDGTSAVIRLCEFFEDKVDKKELRKNVIKLRGMALMASGQFKKAERIFRQALSEQFLHQEQRLELLQLLMMTLFFQKKCLAAYKLHIKICEEDFCIKDPAINAEYFINLTRASLFIKKTGLAFQNIENATSFCGDFKSVEQKYLIGRLALFQAEAYAQDHSLQDASMCLAQADNIFQRINAPHGQMSALIQMAKVEFQSGNYHVAWEKFLKAQEYAELFGYFEPFDQAFVLNFFGFSPATLQYLAHREH